MSGTYLGNQNVYSNNSSIYSSPVKKPKSSGRDVIVWGGKYNNIPIKVIRDSPPPKLNKKEKLNQYEEEFEKRKKRFEAII